MRALLLAAALLSAPPILAANAGALRVEELAAASDLVLRGRVAQVECRWSGDARRIFTFADVETAEFWRGRGRGRIRVLVPGGIVGRIGQSVDGAPRLTQGEHVVLFLVRGAEGSFRLTGLASGKFTVDGALARPGRGPVSYAGSGSHATEGQAEAIPLAELERLVRAARPGARP